MTTYFDSFWQCLTFASNSYPYLTNAIANSTGPGIDRHTQGYIELWYTDTPAGSGHRTLSKLPMHWYASNRGLIRLISLSEGRGICMTVRIYYKGWRAYVRVALSVQGVPCRKTAPRDYCGDIYIPMNSDTWLRSFLS